MANPTTGLVKEAESSHTTEELAHLELRLMSMGLTTLTEVPRLQSVGAQLRTLHLHGNALASLASLDSSCPKLEELVVSSNEIDSLVGVTNLTHLKALDLSCNRLTGLDGLRGLQSLEVLSLAYNRIGALDDLMALWGKTSNLRRLDLRDNVITAVSELLFLCGLVSLEELRLHTQHGRRTNPVCLCKGYRRMVISAVPELRRLDDSGVNADERDPARMSVFRDMPRWPREAFAASTTGVSQASSANGADKAVQHGGHLDQRFQELSALADRAQQALRQGITRGPSASSEALPRSEQALRSILAELRSLYQQRCHERAAIAATAATAPRVQLRAELRLVAAEVKRRQAEHAETKRQLLAEFNALREGEQATRAAAAETASRRLSCVSERRALMHATEETAAAESAARLHSQRAGVVRSHCHDERMEADGLLRALQEEGDVLGNERRQSAAAAERESSSFQRERAEELELQRFEAVASEHQMGTKDMELDLQRLKHRHLQVEESVAEHRKREHEAQESSNAGLLALQRGMQGLAWQEGELQLEVEELNSQVRSQRDAMDSRTRAAQHELAEVQQQSSKAGVVQVAEEKILEQRFRRSLAALSDQSRMLEAEGATAKSEISAREQVLERRQRSVMQSHARIKSLELELERARLVGGRDCDELRTAEIQQQRAAAYSQQCLSRHGRELGNLQNVEHRKASEFVSSALHATVAREEQRLQFAREDLQHHVRDRDRQLSELARALQDVDSIRKQLNALSNVEAQATALSADYSTEHQAMDRLGAELTALQDQARTQEQGHAAKLVQWSQAEADVESNLQRAKSDEQAGEHIAETLRVEMMDLQAVSDARDSSISEFEQQAEDLRVACADTSRNEQEELEQLRAQGLEVADSASRQLSALDSELSTELRRHREANIDLRTTLRAEQEELAKFEAEERAVQQAWQEEREQHAQRAAAVFAALGK